MSYTLASYAFHHRPVKKSLTLLVCFTYDLDLFADIVLGYLSVSKYYPFKIVAKPRRLNDDPCTTPPGYNTKSLGAEM